MHSVPVAPAQPAAIPVSRPVRIWLIIETILGIPAAGLGAFMAMFSPMMFDAPGSMENPYIVTLFWSVVSFPFVMIGALVLAWIAFAMRRDRVALWISLLPIVPVLTGAVAMVMWG